MTDRRDESGFEREVAAAQEVDQSASEAGVDAAGPGTVGATAGPAGAQTGQPTAPAGTGAPESSPSKMVQYDETFVTLEPGQIIRGKVVQVNPDEVMIDVGFKSEGRIPLHELGLKPGQTPGDVVSVGDEIDVFVLKVDESEGNVLLSKRRADSRIAWERLERAKANREIIEAVVTERVKGGLLVDVGVRGFVPASHVERNYVENLDKYVGEKLRLMVIELDRQRNNVVLSHKDVLEAEYEAAKQAAFSRLQEGMIVKGIVRRITDFGAFVDIGGGVEGLLHVSEMAWSRVRHPSDVVSEGQEINVMVLKLDPENERISLSLKETLPDPWINISARYQVGDIVRGTVTRVVDFGAFVQLEDGVEGLVHISQMADRHVTNPSEVVSPGDEIDVKVVSLDEAKRRIGLSIKQADPNYRPPEPRQRGRQRRRENQSHGMTSGPDAHVTLGEVFEDLDLGSLFERREEKEEA